MQGIEPIVIEFYAGDERVRTDRTTANNVPGRKQLARSAHTCGADTIQLRGPNVSWWLKVEGQTVREW